MKQVVRFNATRTPLIIIITTCNNVLSNFVSVKTHRLDKKVLSDSRGDIILCKCHHCYGGTVCATPGHCWSQFGKTQFKQPIIIRNTIRPSSSSAQLWTPAEVTEANKTVKTRCRKRTMHPSGPTVVRRN